ncbi:MAG TPA: ParB-like protein [Caulobacteraceae bacterium]
MSNPVVVLSSVQLEDLRPTQIALGMREVAEKRRQWRKELKDDDPAEFFSRHVFPTVLGPKKRHYLIDHHHLARAMLEEKVKKAMVSVVLDLSDLGDYSFWVFLDDRSWCHPYDKDGRRQDFSAIPKSLAKMEDDDYRSLAGELRRAGGFAKQQTPFGEFLWADFLRNRIKPRELERDFADALVLAMTLARSDGADYLPGWCGPDPPK